MLLRLTTLEDHPNLAHALTSYCREMSLPVEVQLDNPKRLISGDGERVFSYTVSLGSDSRADKAAARELIADHPAVRSVAKAF